MTLQQLKYTVLVAESKSMSEAARKSFVSQPAFSQGSQGSLFLSEEVMSNYDYKQQIKVEDRATMLNLMKGLNGYTLCSGIICEELNGSEYCAVRMESEEYMTIGYLKRKDVPLSQMGKLYIDEIKRYKGKESCQKAIEEGYDCMKIDFIAKDFNGVTLSGEDVELILENHCLTGANTAIQFAKLAKDYNPMLLEEPAIPNFIIHEHHTNNTLQINTELCV